jgi:hypothetical protein
LLQLANHNHHKWVLAIALLALAGWLLVLYQSVQTVQHSGGSDLRSRMVGARLLPSSASPYHYKWHQADGTYLLDPNDHANRPVNGNVATPAALLLLQPLSWLPHEAARWVWAGMEWLCVLLLLAMGLAGRSWPKKLAWSMVPLLLFFGTGYWQYHQDRGQLYIFYATLLGGGWYFLQPKSYRPIWAGLCLLLLVALRPLAVFLPLFTFFHLPPAIRRLWLYLSVLLGMAFVLPLLTSWQQYLQAMAWYGQHYTGNLPPTPFTGPMYTFTGAAIEGSANLTHTTNWPLTCLQPLWYYAHKAGITIQQVHGYLLLGLATAVAAGYLYRRAMGANRLSVVFLTGFVLMLVAELLSFLPRAPYNITWWVAGVMLLSRVVNLGSFVFFKGLWLVLVGIGLYVGSVGHWAEGLLLVSAVLALALQKREGLHKKAL